MRCTRCGARWRTSRCDIVLDLTGCGAVPPELRDGYLRADPATRGVLAPSCSAFGVRAAYIAVTDALCAHSRSRIRRLPALLDLCPAARSRRRRHVAIDPALRRLRPVRRRVSHRCCAYTVPPSTRCCASCARCC